jgi:hypothetical protein
MLKKNHLKKKTADQIASLFADETNPSNIILCSQTLADRNQALAQIKHDLLHQMTQQRVDLKKLAF